MDLGLFVDGEGFFFLLLRCCPAVFHLLLLFFLQLSGNNLDDGVHLTLAESAVVE